MYNLSKLNAKDDKNKKAGIVSFRLFDDIIPLKFPF